mgnify:CR=1 FL=1
MEYTETFKDHLNNPRNKGNIENKSLDIYTGIGHNPICSDLVKFQIQIKENQIFKISNPAISPGQSTLTILNRWGEIIAKVDALVGWDGLDQNGMPYPGGIYVFLFDASYNNKRISRSGTFLLIN